MGQMRQTSDNLTEHEEQDRRAAGYIDEPKNESYLPSSVHGSPRHMAALDSPCHKQSDGHHVRGL